MSITSNATKLQLQAITVKPITVTEL